MKAPRRGELGPRGAARAGARKREPARAEEARLDRAWLAAEHQRDLGLGEPLEVEEHGGAGLLRVGHSRHYAARSLIFAFPDPEKAEEKKPIPFDPAHPFRNLGLRVVRAGPGAAGPAATLGLEEVELTLREHSGTEGFQQLLRPSSF